MRTIALAITLAAGMIVLAGCPGSRDQKEIVMVDGSSTVEPISSGMAEEFMKAQPGMMVTVGTSGTGGGFKKFFAANEAERTHINNASRPIKEAELALAEQLQIELIELPIAYDGVCVVVNKENDFVDYLTVEELHRIWQAGSTVKKWSDVRGGWPAQEIQFFAPGADSGTFDYFTETVNGESGNCRKDCQFSEDDHVLVTGVAGNQHGLGFFGYAYYAASAKKLKAVPIGPSKEQAVLPTPETIEKGTYTPLSRPLFIYVRRSASEIGSVDAFVRFYLDNAPKLCVEVGYTPMPSAVYDLVKKRYEERKTGSLFSREENKGKPTMDVLKQGG